MNWNFHFHFHSLDDYFRSCSSYYWLAAVGTRRSRHQREVQTLRGWCRLIWERTKWDPCQKQDSPWDLNEQETAENETKLFPIELINGFAQGESGCGIIWDSLWHRAILEDSSEPSEQWLTPSQSKSGWMHNPLPQLKSRHACIRSLIAVIWGWGNLFA